MTGAPATGDQPHEGEARRATLTGVRPAQRKRLTEEVTEHLLALIASDRLEELALPPERDLCDQLSVSRNVLREALAALDHVGVIETRGKTRVASTARARAQLVARVPSGHLTRELMLEPIEVRLILEPEAAALAAERATGDDLRAIERWLDAMAAGIRDDESVVEYDSAFHVSIARAASNRMLAELVGALAEALRPSRELSFRPSGSAKAALEDHYEIFAAIGRRDARGARGAMDAHLRHVEEFIRATIAPT